MKWVARGTVVACASLALDVSVVGVVGVPVLAGADLARYEGQSRNLRNLQITTHDSFTLPQISFFSQSPENKFERVHQAENGTEDDKIRSSDNDTTSVSEAGDDEEVLSYVFVFSVFLPLSALLVFITTFIFSCLPITPPFSVVWFLTGSALGALGFHSSNGGLFAEGIRNLGYIPPDIIYYVLLPILLYEGAITTNWHKFATMFGVSTYLATVGVIVTALLLGCLCRVTFDLFKTGAAPNWWDAMLLGATLSSTDPVAVISVLRALHCPEKLLSLFESESLINDGTSVVFFQLFHVFAAGESATVGRVAWLIVRLLFFSPLFGVLSSMVFTFVLRHCKGHNRFQSVLVSFGSYLTYFVGEHFCHLSGPLAIVCYGLYICSGGYRKLDRQAQTIHINFVKALAAVAESSIFFISGVIVYRLIFQTIQSDDWLLCVGRSVVVYLYMNVVRFCMVFGSYCVLTRIVYGLNVGEMALLVWGGLRGAIVLALALMLERDEALDEQFRLFAAFAIAMSTFLSLLVNGTTFEAIFRWSKLYPTPAFRKLYLQKVLRLVESEFEMAIWSDHTSHGLRSFWAFDDPLCTGRSSHQDKARLFKAAFATIPDFNESRVTSQGSVQLKLPDISLIWHEYDRIRKAKKDVDTSPTVSPRGITSCSDDDDAESQVASHPMIDGDASAQMSLPRSESSIRLLRHKSAFVIPGFTSNTPPVLIVGGGNDSLNISLTLRVMNKLNEKNAQGGGTSSDAANGSEDGGVSRQPSTVSEAKQMLDGEDFSNYMLERDLSHIRTLDQCRESCAKVPPLETLHAERQLEVFNMVFNWLQQEYLTLYNNRILDSRAHKMLEKSTELGMDFALIKKHATTSSSKSFSRTESDQSFVRIGLRHRRVATESQTALDVEWEELVRRLHTSGYIRISDFLRVKCLWWVPGKLRIRLALSHCMADIAAVVGFVHAHERLWEAGGKNFEILLQGQLLTALRNITRLGREQLKLLRVKNVEAFDAAMVVFTSLVFLRIKISIVEKIAQRGLLLMADKDAIVGRLLEQQSRLELWRG